METHYASKVRDGMDVCDANEEKLGTVQEVYDASPNESNSGGSYLRVRTGFLGMGAEHHIPISAIKEVRDERIYLRVDKDHLDELGYGDAAHEGRDEFDGTAVERTAATTSMQDAPIAGGRSSRQPAEDDARTLQLREEELFARKRTVETGAVALHTDVVSEQRTLQVPVTREEVTIDRHAVDRRASDRPIGEAASISVPVRNDEVTLEKQPVVYEEVNVGKRSIEETKQLTDTVRREEAVIDRHGDIDVADGQARPTPRQP